MNEISVWPSGPFRKCVRWQAEDGSSLEHAVIAASDDGIAVESVVIGDRFSIPYGASYQILCASDWSLRRVRIQITGGGKLELFSDGNGNWKDSSGRPIMHLCGCIDVDISATPFTNTLPIRRLALDQKERRLIRVVYIALPQLEATAAEQAYTCLEPARLYRYEGLFRNFSANLEVDEHGLVRDYPSLFQRVAMI